MQKTVFNGIKLSLLFLAFIFSTTAKAYNVSGIIIDNTGEPLPEAGVRILAQRDSSYVKGGAADINGAFTLSGIKSGKYILQCDYVGYQKHFQNIELAGKSLKVDTITLYESSYMLKEATVTAIKTPIKVMEDTVEFNADSYKTQPNAVVEDLLKRLPGVEVDSEGKITANGKTVTKILVDGKEFFSDDPKVASKNLPVSMVDKLQVVDRKSDLARMTGVDDGEDETVINLTVKKGMKNGWFGTVEAGYGTDDRYQVTYNVNRFWNDNQITFIGSANNTNDLGFTDGNGNRFRRFGGNEGINNSQSFGINFNVGKEEIIRVGGDVMYSHTDRDTYKRIERMYNFADSFPTQSTLRNATDKGHNIRGDFRVQWNPDSTNSFDFRPRFSYNTNDSWSDELSQNFSYLRNHTNPYELAAESQNTGDSHGKSFEMSGEGIFNHKFRSHPGRSLSLQFRYQLSNVREDENSYSINRFLLLDSIDVYDQYLDNHTWNNTLMSRITWTEPLGNPKNGNFLTFAYRLQYRWNNADKDVYDHPVIYDELGLPVIDYDILNYNDTLSDRFRNKYFNQDIRIGYKKVSKIFNLDAGFSLVPQMSGSKDLVMTERTIPTRWVWNWAPFVRARFKFTKTRSMNIFYRGRSSQPTLSQLQPVEDKTDPLKIIIGNPNLDPTFTHNIMARYQDFNSETQRSVMVMFDAQLAQNSIVSKTTYNPETSGQITTYENVNGVWSARLMNMFSMPLSRKTWTINNMMFANFNQQVGFNNGIRNTSRSFSWHESFGIAFRPDNLELELRPLYRVQITNNSLSSTQSSTVHNYGGMFNGTYYTPFGIVLNSDLRYTATSGYSAGYDTKSWMWNASISYQFLPGNAATIAVKAYDLLKQQNNINRTIAANYTEDVEFNTLTRYFMFTFTYRFNTFGKGNEPESKTQRRWGPPGMGPGPRR